MSSWFQRNRYRYPANWEEIAWLVKEEAGWKCEVCLAEHGPSPHVLTVDHLDFDPANCKRENLMALCQRCHLKRQGMNPPPRTREDVLLRMLPKGHQLYLFPVLS